MIAIFSALGFANGIILAAYGWSGWQMTVAAAGLGGLAWFAQRHRVPAIALAVVVCWLCARFGMGRRGTLAPSLGTVMVYTLTTGLPASAVRAGIMNAVGLTFWALRPKSARSGLATGFGVAALCILGMSPDELFRPGFQLSFLAVAWLLSGLTRILLDASLVGAAWLGCPVVERPGLVGVGLYMRALALFSRCSQSIGMSCGTLWRTSARCASSSPVRPDASMFHGLASDAKARTAPSNPGLSFPFVNFASFVVNPTDGSRFNHRSASDARMRK